METLTSPVECRTTPRAGLEFAASEGAPPGKRVFVVALSVVLVAAAAGAVALRTAGRADAAVFRYAFTQGAERTYSMTARMRFSPEGLPGEKPVEGTMSAAMRMRVLEVAADGSALVEVTVSDVTVTGAPAGSVPAPISVKMRLTKGGRPLSIEGGSGALGLGGVASGLNDIMSGFAGPDGSDLFPQFPDDAIAPGDTWDKTVTVPIFGQKITYRTKGRHEGFEDTQYGRAARMRAEVDVPLDVSIPIGQLVGAFASGFGDARSQMPPGIEDAKMTMKGSVETEGVAVVLPADGDLVRAHMDLKMRIAIGAVGFPAELTSGMPSALGMNGTISMDVVRTG